MRRSTQLRSLLPSLAILLQCMVAPTLEGQARAAAYQPPDDIEFRTAPIMSEGVRIHAELFSLRSLSGTRLPTVVTAHGWGGNASQLRTDAVDLARAGYLVVNFDYRGWGQSDGRVILRDPPPAERERSFAATVEEIRGYVEPNEQTDDWFNVIHWVMAEPMADTSRVGLRGSSYSGGHVVYVAAFDPRVKALVSQVPATDITAGMSQMFAAANEDATRRARGEIGYPEPFVREFNLTGLPIKDKALRHSPNQVADRVQAASLFIVAEREELFTNESQAAIAFERVRGPKEYVVIPDITHYGIYNVARERAIELAIDWFDRYLKR